MNKRIKILSILVAILMLFTVFTMSAYATSGVEDPGTGEVETPDPEPEPEPTPDPEPTLDPQPTPTDPPVVEDPTYSGDSGVIDDPYTGGGYVDNGSGNSYYFDEDEMVNSIENSAGSVKDATNLYDTSDINESALKETKWDNITLDTSKANADALDFSAIKDNSSSNDDGKWIIYTGFALIGLSIIGILYFIIATATYKKKLKNLKRRQQRHDSHRARDDYGDYPNDYPTQSDYNRRYNGRKRYAGEGMGYAERKRLKADTAEINLPNKYRARH